MVLDQTVKQSAAEVYGASVEETPTASYQEEIKDGSDEQTPPVRKDTKKKKGLIVILSVVAVLLVAAIVLTFLFFIPMYQTSQADEMLRQNQHQNALLIYNDYSDYGTNAQKIRVIKAILQIENGYVEEGIGAVLDAEVPVKITYRNGSDDVGTVYSYHNRASFEGLRNIEREGMVLEKWRMESYSYSFDGESLLEVTLIAEWGTGTYRIEYDLAGGTLSKGNPTQYSSAGEGFTLNNPTREGYTFIGWTGTGLNEPTVNVTLPKGSTGNRSYTANWEKSGYLLTLNNVAANVKVTLNYNYSGAQSQEIYLAKGATFGYPDIPTRSGYVFSGWYTDSACTNRYSFTGSLTFDLTLYAQWQVNSKGAVINVGTSVSSYLYGTSMQYYAFVPLVSGTVTVYTNGNYDTRGFLYSASMLQLVSDDDSGNDTNFQYTYTVMAGQLYYIGFKAYSASSAGYVTLHVSGISKPTSSVIADPSTDGSIGNGASVSYSYGSQVTAAVAAGETFYLPTPTRTGYTFDGWYHGNTKITTSYITVREDTVLTPRWK